MITKIVDVATSDKIGQMLPGTSILIVDEDLLISEQPSHALLLAHHIGDRLVRKLRLKGYAGEFIWPIPPGTGDRSGE